VELTSERRVVVWIRSVEQRDWSAT
jgi:hypothetical protein